MKKDQLPELVDSFGRTSDAPFDIDTLLGYLNDRLGRVDQAEAYELAASSSYLFESWKNPASAMFIPRRLFFQGAEFRITPTREEVEGGFLFPGHRFMPFISREVFPADAWLVLPDGSAPRVRQLELPVEAARNSLCFFGNVQTLEYLKTESPENEARSTMLLATVYDLRDFYAECGFKPGDSLMVRVLDWLQGVFSISHAPVDSLHIDLLDARRWTDAMRDAYEEMQEQLGPEGDCYEQFAVMLLLGNEGGAYPLMKSPPLSLAAFFNMQDDIGLKEVGDRAVFYDEDGDPLMDMINEAMESMGELDAFFKELGLSISEAEAEAYMRDALVHEVNSPDAVLARVAAGRALYFRSADAQEEFHDLWCELWEDVRSDFVCEDDPYTEVRSRLLALNDRCFAAIRRLDRQDALEQVMKNPAFNDFNLLTASLSSMLVMMNSVGDDRIAEPQVIEEMAETLAPAVEDCLARLNGG